METLAFILKTLQADFGGISEQVELSEGHNALKATLIYCSHLSCALN